MKCPVCLNEEFTQSIVLKQRLIDEWNLSPDEVDYINTQQGFQCTKCSCNLRTMTLASAIMKLYSFKGSFEQFRFSVIGRKLKILEVNAAGGLHKTLKYFKNIVFAEYPKVDMQNLVYKNESFDLIVHSDTLEHVEKSSLALKECFRVLKQGGYLCYTIPIVYGRLNRRRDFLTNSYHGSQEEMQGEDFKVWTEYGADFWVEIIEAGFKNFTINTLDDLSALAICAQKESEIKYKGDFLVALARIYFKLERRISLILN